MSTVTFTKKDHIESYDLFSSSNGYEIHYSSGFNSQTKSLLKIAVLRNLYVDGWSLLPWYLDILINNEDNVDLALIAKEQEYSGVTISRGALGIIISRGDINIKTRETMFFIKPEFRRKGLATTLIEFFNFKDIKLGTGFYGVEGSDLFLKKHNIDF